MKVVVFKLYLYDEKKKDLNFYSNYLDLDLDLDTAWHNFNIIEEARDMTLEEIEVLKKAINYFNEKKNCDYTLSFHIINDDNEFNSFMKDFKKYEAVESAKLEEENIAKLEKILADKEKKEAMIKNRSIKKIAKDLNISEDEVAVMFANKTK